MKSQQLRLLTSVLLFLSALQTASAFYDPAPQRWINRDPIEEYGGRNLFKFVDNSPGVMTDSFGKSVFGCENPCMMAVVIGLVNLEDEAGFTVCCGGRVYPCAMRTVGPTVQITNPKVIQASLNCILKHETEHVPFSSCPPCSAWNSINGMTRGISGPPDNECDRWRDQLECFASTLLVCAGDDECLRQWRIELEAIKTNVAKFCGKGTR